MHQVKNIVTRRAIFLRTKEMSRRWRTSYIIRDTVLHALKYARGSIERETDTILVYDSFSTE